MKQYHLFKYFFARELKDKYLGNITGISWIFIQPIITLLIYWVIFDKIFKARIPEAEEIGFIIYLAIGFWPWLAFSESVLKSIMAVSDKESLIGKVNIDLKLPVIATITANYFLNILGYLVVLLSLVLFANKFDYSALPLVIYPIIQMYFFAIALGLLLSALQIFIRDTMQLMTTLMTLWFFMTPIIYSESILPERFKAIIQFNPIYTPISFIHKALITKSELPWMNMAILSLFIFVFVILSIKIFNRLSHSFEDFK